MAILREDIILTRIRRQPGTYLGTVVTPPVDATYVTVVADSRSLWTPRGVRAIVLSMQLEVFQDGAWIILGGFTAGAEPKMDKEGQPLDASSVRVRLPRNRSTQPEIRTVLECASACTSAVHLLFDDVPLPVRPLQEHQSVTYDNDNEAVGTNVTSVTIGAFAVGNNANRCMLVGCASYDPTAGDSLISTINHNGSTAGWASVITDTGPGATTDRSSIWRKVAPDVATATVVVTVGGTCNELGANALSVYDVDQTTPIAGAVSAEGTASPASRTVAAVTNDLVYDAVYSYGALTHVGVVGASQTQRANNVVATYGGARTLFLASTEPGVTTTTMSWTITDSDEWVQTACAIKAAAAPAGKVTKNTRAYPLGIQAGYARRQGLARR